MAGKAIMDPNDWKGAGFDISPEEEADILKDVDSRLEELAKVIFTVWQRQQPAQRVN